MKGTKILPGIVVFLSEFVDQLPVFLFGYVKGNVGRIQFDDLAARVAGVAFKAGSARGV
jgi:hypothetical protein